MSMETEFNQYQEIEQLKEQIHNLHTLISQIGIDIGTIKKHTERDSKDLWTMMNSITKKLSKE